MPVPAPERLVPRFYAAPDTELIRRWWPEPGKEVAVATGLARLLVLDVDRHPGAVLDAERMQNSEASPQVEADSDGGSGETAGPAPRTPPTSSSSPLFPYGCSGLFSGSGDFGKGQQRERTGTHKDLLATPGILHSGPSGVSTLRGEHQNTSTGSGCGPRRALPFSPARLRSRRTLRSL
ncbi:bifunctional DNA primase/polymerase [Streptomyces sp. NPDC058394]|uniref:bifunctional DNA primase/polymerase n=1 Tax=Streptomyces sp. NPDC058394 TaxID=3346477 RepID=UPI0036637248